MIIAKEKYKDTYIVYIDESTPRMPETLLDQFLAGGNWGGRREERLGERLAY